MFPAETTSAAVLAAAILAAPSIDPQAPGLAGALEPLAQQASQEANQLRGGEMMTRHPYVGMWVTADGHVRQELLPNGRYDEARGSRRSAYRGRYEVRGTHIAYWDDTGFAADGTFVNENELHHGGMIFHRER